MIPHDYHMHSNFSPDCDIPMEVMCQSAVSKGIAEIGFTEHHDLHADEKPRDWFKPAPWWQEIERCRQKFAGQLTLRAGIEIGEPHIFASQTQAILAQWPFDYCLGSLHWVDRESVFDPRYFEKRSADQAFRLFFIELERMTRLGGFDILSHFDVPVRVGFDVYGEYHPKRYEDVIRPALQNCVEHGIALDLNTAALRRRAKILTPSEDILRWYVELGGERVTLGSDAHRPENIGAGLDVALSIAHNAGLKYVTHFERRQAKLLPMP